MKINYIEKDEVYNFTDKYDYVRCGTCDICGNTLSSGYNYILQKLKAKELIPSWYKSVCCSCAYVFKHLGHLRCHYCGWLVRPQHISSHPVTYIPKCENLNCEREYQWLDKPIENWYKKIQEMI